MSRRQFEIVLNDYITPESGTWRLNLVVMSKIEQLNKLKYLVTLHAIT